MYPEKKSHSREDKSSVRSTELEWFALRVRSNFETTTARLLENAGYEVLLPTYRTLRRWSDRVKQIQVPLFPGYVFCQMDINHRTPVLRTPGIVRIIGFGDDSTPVPKHEIASVRAIVESRVFSKPWPFLAVGDRIIVERGPLAGTEGFLISAGEEYRLVVSITLLRRSMAVELEREWVRPADHTSRHVPAVA